MKWKRGGGRAGDIIDARGAGGRGGGIPIGRAGGGLGIVGVLVVLALQLLGGGSGGGSGFDIPGGFSGGGAPVQSDPIPASQDPDRDLKDFSAYVVSNVNDSWAKRFKQDGRPYRRVKLVFFSRGVQTGCGSATSDVGPFYCPPDQRMYLDLSFYDDMVGKLGGKGGDFAWAYVIAHEAGHHIQKLLGTSDEVDQSRRQNPGDANALSVRLELQADCYAGVWAQGVFAAGDLQKGDIAEALDAASSVGDDRLQRRAGGSVDPDSFTHGTSEQRQRWFNAGRANGDPGDCDTFGADSL
ncbi:MAG: Neutral zinc metallopeptidase family [Solirubrobacterales bacterium]|nr:Neutral zinc metallopeptidase family [Solirubrobacterales bacterium]